MPDLDSLDDRLASLNGHIPSHETGDKDRLIELKQEAFPDDESLKMMA